MPGTPVFGAFWGFFGAFLGLWGFLGLYGGFLAEIRPFYPLQNKAKYPLNPPLWERNPQNPDSSAQWDPCGYGDGGDGGGGG